MPQKWGISVFRAGWVAGGRVSRASLAWEAGRWVFALAGHAFTLARACDAGIGNERGLKRRLSISPRHDQKVTKRGREIKKESPGVRRVQASAGVRRAELAKELRNTARGSVWCRYLTPRPQRSTPTDEHARELMAAARVAALLTKHKATVAVAESSAGGAISRSLVAVRGASNYYVGGAVCYTAASKHTLLGLTPAKPTATEAHAKELAMAVRERLSADWGIGETGVAGPGKNARGVAPGVCAIAVVGPGVSKTLMLFPDSTLSAADAYGQAPLMPREEAMEVFGERALELLETALMSDSSS